MPAPSWILLAWSGCAATCVAALAGSLFGGRAHAPWALVPGVRSGLGAALATLAAGTLLYPIIYGMIFETMGRADMFVGAAIGAVHAVLAFFAGRPRELPSVAFRLAFVHLVYGTTIGFLYVTP
jgi:hypothetical protein